MALTRVQGTGKAAGGGLSIVLPAFGTLPTVGNGLVVTLSVYQNTTQAPTCSDNQGNVYLVGRWTDNQYTTIFYCPKITASAAPFTITISFPGQSSNWYLAGAIEVGGVGAGLGIDRAVGANASTSAPSTGATLALTASEVFVVSVLHIWSASMSFSTVEAVSPPWTQEYEVLNDYPSGEADSRVLTGVAGSTTQCSWAMSAPAQWGTALVAFKGDTPLPPPSAFLAQLPLEVAVIPTTPAEMRLAQLPLEVAVLSSAPTILQVTQHVVEVLNQQPADLRVTQYAVETLVSGAFEERLTTGTRLALLNNAYAPSVFKGNVTFPTVSKQVHVVDTNPVMPGTSARSWTGIPGGVATFLTPETNKHAIWAVAGTFRNLALTVRDPPGVGKNWTFTFRKNGAPTSLTVLISDTATVGQDLINTVTVAPGDLLTLEAFPSGTPAAVGTLMISLEFESTALGESGYSSCRTSLQNSTTAANYQGVFRMENEWDGTTPTTGGVRNIAAASGAITGLYVWIGTAPGVGKAYTFTLWKNGVKQDGTLGSVDTRLVFTGVSPITGSSTFNLAVLPGDVLTLECLPSGTSVPGILPTASIRFLATTPGQSQFCGGTTSSSGSSGTRWTKLPSVLGFFDSSESYIESPGGAPTPYILQGFRVQGDIAVGVGSTHTYDVRLNQSSYPGLPKVVITGPAIEGVDPLGSIMMTSGDKFCLQDAPTGTAFNNAPLRWGLVQSIGITSEIDVQAAFRASTASMVGPKVAVVPLSGGWFGETGGLVWVD